MCTWRSDMAHHNPPHTHSYRASIFLSSGTNNFSGGNGEGQVVALATAGTCSGSVLFRKDFRGTKKQQA